MIQYAAVLSQICKDRGINVNLGHSLIEVNGDKKEALFKTGDGEVTVKYDLVRFFVLCYLCMCVCV